MTSDTIEANPRPRETLSGQNPAKGIVNKIKEQNRVRKEFQRTRHPPLKEESNRLRREIQKNTEACRLKRWGDLVQKSQSENPHSVPRILKKERKPMPKVQRGHMRCLTDHEKAEALADTFAIQFSPNYRNDPKQERDSPSEIARRGWHPERSTEESSAQVSSQPDDNLQRRTSPRVLSLRVEIVKDSPCFKTQEGPPLI
ncbi:hypothetical protein Trydic_g11733 [Trypoxylus dichotomus]